MSNNGTSDVSFIRLVTMDTMHGGGKNRCYAFVVIWRCHGQLTLNYQDEELIRNTAIVLIATDFYTNET